MFRVHSHMLQRKWPYSRPIILLNTCWGTPSILISSDKLKENGNTAHVANGNKCCQKSQNLAYASTWTKALTLCHIFFGYAWTKTICPHGIKKEVTPSKHFFKSLNNFLVHHCISSFVTFQTLHPLSQYSTISQSGAHRMLDFLNSIGIVSHSNYDTDPCVLLMMQFAYGKNQNVRIRNLIVNCLTNY